MIPVRSETLRVKLTVDKTLADKYKDEVTCLSRGDFPIAEGDILHLNYQFSIDYFGNIVKRFQAIRKLLDDPAVVRDMSLNELKHGESLIVELLDEIRKFQTPFAERVE
jgi:hypothetical protein